MSYTPPTDEQLERFIEVQLGAVARRLQFTDESATFAAEIAMRNPAIKAEWLGRHRELQEGLDALATTRGAEVMDAKIGFIDPSERPAIDQLWECGVCGTQVGMGSPGKLHPPTCGSHGEMEQKTIEAWNTRGDD